MQTMKKIVAIITDLESNYDLVCSECGTNRYVDVELLGKIKRVPCLCKCQAEKNKKQAEDEKNREQQKRLERLKLNSLMDKQFEKCTFDRWEYTEENKKLYNLAYKYASNWSEIKSENIGLLLHGSTGLGKTYASFCIANKLLSEYIPIIAISSIGILNRIKETYNSYGTDAEGEIINNLKNASLLIIDDLGAENDTRWVSEKLYEIIDSRYRDNKPMIVTTNLNLTQLKDKLTVDGVSRTFDRLIEICIQVEVKGKSRRIDKAKTKEEKLKSILLGR